MFRVGHERHIKAEQPVYDFKCADIYSTLLHMQAELKY